MLKPWDILQSADPQVFHIIESELHRQEYGIEMIASENFASPAVLMTMANVMANKYAEGRPSKRYYGGCEEVDRLEELAEKRACQLFGANFANVQPHSGAQANCSVFLGLLNPKDRILGLELSHGGHLTHGSKVNSSGIYYDSHFYELNSETELIDMNIVRERAHEVKPKMIIAGISAYPRKLDFRKFREIADEVGAYFMVDMAHIAGLVATGLHESPLPHAHVVTTTTHKTLRGPRGGLILWNDEELTAPINRGVFPGTQGGPLEHIIAAKAVCFKEALDPEFKEYQASVLANSRALASSLLEHGLQLVTGGTDNHLVLLNLLDEEVSGKAFEKVLESIGITVNKNTVPREKRSPFVTSGIRLGTPALTTRGMGTEQMKEIGRIIAKALILAENEKLSELEPYVRGLAKSFPLYPEWNTREGS